MECFIDFVETIEHEAHDALAKHGRETLAGGRATEIKKGLRHDLGHQTLAVCEHQSEKRSNDGRLKAE